MSKVTRLISSMFRIGLIGFDVGNDLYSCSLFIRTDHVIKRSNRQWKS